MKKIILFACYLLLFTTTVANAFGWQDLWFTKNQQAQRKLHAGKTNEAAELFKDTKWKGAAHYRGGEYKQAFDEFGETPDITALYNQANALAHMNQYQKAIERYEHILTQAPNHQDAKFNRDLLKRLLQQQQQNSESQDKKNSDEQKNQQSQDQKANDKDSAKDLQNNKNNSQSKQNKQDTEQKDTKYEQQKAKQVQYNPQKQATEQLLHRIPDDPGGLLKQKFLREHQRRNIKSYKE